MFSLFQIPANIQIPEGIQIPENIDMEALNNVLKQAQQGGQVSVTDIMQLTGNNVDIAGIFWGIIAPIMAVVAIIGLIALIVWILSLVNLYHWGMTDQSAFEAVGEKKKKWFKILVIVPIVAGLVNIVPLLGQIASIIIYIYWLVMVLIYFFSVRKKVSGRSGSS